MYKNDCPGVFCFEVPKEIDLVEMKIFIVQPGVDSKKITQDMIYLLSCTQSYLIDTYGVSLSITCT